MVLFHFNWGVRQLGFISYVYNNINNIKLNIFYLITENKETNCSVNFLFFIFCYLIYTLL